MPHGPFDAERDMAAWITGMEHSIDPLFYAIIDLATNRAIGVAAYLRIDTLNRTVEVGWLTFSSLLRRSTLATEAMHLMARHAFDLGFRRYEWKCNALNAPSIAAAERLGFSFEGVFRNAVIVKGHNRDTAWFAMTDSDWSAIRTAQEEWLRADNFDDTGLQRTSLRDATLPLLHSHWPTLTVSISSATRKS
jgi:RimJ/RimL family protein N-acetyltransferase